MITEHEFKIREFTFTWKIQNFMWCKHKCNENLISPTFTIDEARTTNLFLTLYPHGKGVSGFVSLYLNRSLHDEGPQSFNIRYELAVVDFQGVFHVLCAGEPTFRRGTGRGYRTFLERTSLLSCDQNRLLPEDVLTVCCRIQPIEEEPERSPNEPPGFEKLSQDLTILYLNKLNCDIILCCDDEEFLAHKAVLRARCPELIETFSGQLLGQLHDKVSLVFLKLKATVLEALLLYLYSGKLDGLSCQQLEGLQIVAENLKLYHLKAKLNLFESSVTATTIIEVQRRSFTWTIISPQSIWSNSYVYNSVNISLWLNIKFPTEGRQNIKINVYRFQVKQESFLLTCKLSLLNANQECLNKAACTTWVSENTVLVLPCFPKDTGRKESFSDSSLTLDFMIETSEGGIRCDSKKTSLVSSKCEIPNRRSLRNLSIELKNLFSSERICDVVVHVRDNQIFAHKAILSARSPVFSRILATTSHMVINLHYNLVHSLVSYMYSGVVHFKSWEDSLVMYLAAKNYQVHGLMEECVEYMKSYLNFNNACKILLLAVVHKEQNLEIYVKDFVCSRSAAFLESESWIRFAAGKPNLARKILRKMRLHNPAAFRTE